MTKDSSIPIGVYGRHASIAKGVIELMPPEYDVVHAVIGEDPSVAILEFRAVLSGDLSQLPSSGLGSNMRRPEAERRVLLSIGAGAGVPDEEFEQVKREIGNVGDVKFVKITIEDVRATGHQGGPDPSILGPVWKKKLKEIGL